MKMRREVKKVLDEIVENNYPSLVMYAYKRLSYANKDKAKDCINDAYLKIIEEDYSDLNLYQTFLGVIRNCVRSYNNKTRKEYAAKNVLYNHSKEKRIDKYIDKRKIRKSYKELTDTEKKIVKMHYTESIPFKEIAVELEKPYNTIKSIHLRLKTKIKKQLKKLKNCWEKDNE